MAECLGCWTCNLRLVVLSSSPLPCDSLDLFLVAPSSNPWLVCQLGFSTTLYLFTMFVCIGPEKPYWRSGQ